MTLCAINFGINVGIAQIAPFYPELANHEAGLTYSQIGTVVAMNPAGAILFSFVCSRVIARLGRRNALITGLLLQGSATIGVGALPYLAHHQAAFLWVSLAYRFLQGVSRSLIAGVTFTYVPLFWRDDLNRTLEILETITGYGALTTISEV